MAILHNLSDVADNLSGFDPVDGISGTVGRSWILWKIMEGLLAFDSNIKKITNTSPTPTFLQGEVGSNLQTEPARSRSTTGDSIRFYHANDPGLLESPQHAIVYEFRVGATSGYGLNLFRVRFVKDGSAVYAPGSDSDILNTGNSTNIYHMYNFGIGSPTFTDMSLIPKVIFWKSANVNAIMAVNKSTSLFAGGFIWANPAFAGYRNTVGAITDGVDHRCSVHFNAASGSSFIEAFTQTYAGSPTTVVGGLSPICLAGQLPTGLFSFNSVSNLIHSYLRIGIKNDASLKSVSDQLEGIVLANPTAANQSYASVYRYTADSTWYLHFGLINDGRETHKLLLELGTS